jgi:hypothetical protein
LAPGEAGSGHHASGASSTPSPVGVRTRHHLSTAVWWWWLTVWCGRRPGWRWRQCGFFWKMVAMCFLGSQRVPHGESGRRVPNQRALPPMLVSPLYVAVCLELLMAKVVDVCPIDDTRRRGPSPDMAPLCPGRRV